MPKKPTYEELIKRVKELEKEALEQSSLERDLRNFETAVESSINAIGFTDLEGKIIYVNDSCVRMWGYNNKGEMLGRFLPEFWEGDGVFRTIKELNERGVAGGEDVGKRKDGSLLNIQFTASMVKDEAGNPSFMFGSFFDITERKQAEEALRESEEKYRTLIDNAGEAIIVAQDGVIKFTNPKGEELYGRSQEELASRSLTYFIHEEDREMVGEHHKRRLKGEEPPNAYSFRIVDKNGNIKLVELVVALFSWDDKPATLCFMTDITDRKQAEESIKRKIMELNSFINNIPDLAWVKDADSRFIAVNRAFGESVGMDPGSLINQTCEVCFAKKEAKKFREDDLRVMEDGKQEIIEEKIIDSKKNEVWLETIKSPILDELGKVIGTVGIARDITKRKQAELSLIERGKELENKSYELEEVNAALKVLLKHMEEGKKEFEEKVVANLKKLVFPYLEKLYNSLLNDRQKVYSNIIKSNLEDIVSPFPRQLSLKFSDLTPSEIQVAGLVKDGKTTKEIADLLNSSTGAVNFHRNNIRKKLGLRNTKTNLRSFLLSLS